MGAIELEGGSSMTSSELPSVGGTCAVSVGATIGESEGPESLDEDGPTGVSVVPAVRASRFESGAPRGVWSGTKEEAGTGFSMGKDEATDPAVGGSIPSSLMRYSFTGALAVRVEHRNKQATWSCTSFTC
uniref:Uncharacterized protein n=1 Tax=Hyaloperonospora arabidopsidis (strain Emoy2) TaxID=559515 RepID=M4C2Z2_HYAAE